MELTQDTCYLALLSHDRRFDGLFFTCVKSTGIYCRPICPAITPHRSQCVFVPSASMAEKAGFRPCLRCRPEYAPANPLPLGQGDVVVHDFAAYIDETLLADETLSQAAAKFGMSDRHLRRLFVQAYGVEPKEYVTTQRLLFAKQLLQDTAMPVAQVAYASGFATPDRLTVNLKQSYGFTPAMLRKQTAPPAPGAQTFVLRADYRPPFDWDSLLSFLGGRATTLERIENNVYYRRIGQHEIAVANNAAKQRLHITVPFELAQQSHDIIRRVRHLFDLDANPDAIAADLQTDNLLRPLVVANPGVCVPGCWDDFELLLRVIVGQQVSVAGATTIMRRLVEQIGSTPAAIAAASPEAIARIGMPLKRATTIWTVGTLVANGELNLKQRNPRILYDQLVTVPGIGPWTAEYLLMRMLHWPDALPAGDLGLQKAVVPGQRLTERQLRERAEAWRPWRSYATILLWKSLENKGG